MTIVFKDGQGEIITRIDEAHSISHHNRVLLNPDGYIPEGESVMLFTKENLKDFQGFYDDIINQAMHTARRCMETVEKSETIIQNLTTENQQLKKLNQELTKEIRELKGKGN